MNGFDAGSVVAHVTADIGDFKKKMGEAQEVTGNLKNGLSAVGSTIADVGRQAAIFTGIIAGGVVVEMKRSVDAFEDADRGMKQMDAALNSTGATAGMTKDSLIALSKELEHNSTLSDESVVAAENMALSFTAIKSDVFPGFIKAVADTAYGMNNGLTPSAMQLADMTKQLGKAMQDPEQGLGALHRVGVNTDELKEKFLTVTDIAGRQKLIIQELGTEFGGRYSASIQTFGGKMEQLKNNINDLEENLGELIVTFLGPLLSAINNFVNSREFQIWLGEAELAIIKFIQALKPLSDWIAANQDLVISFLKGAGVALAALLIIGTITLLVAALTDPLVLVAGAIAGLYVAWDQNFLGIRDITNQVVAEIINFFTNYLQPAIAVLVAWWQANHVQIIADLQAAWQIIVGILQVAWNIFYGIIKVGLALLAGNWDEAWKAIKESVSGAWTGIENIFSGMLHFLGDWGKSLFDSLTKPFRDAWNAINDLMNKIKDAADPNKRHSPSLVDRVSKGVADLNKAWGKLEMPITATLSSSVAPAVSSSTANSAINSISIDLSGAIISDNAAAQRIGEMVGDSIIKKLNASLRF